MSGSGPYDEEQLDPVSEPPEGLGGQPIEDIIEAVREWFGENFEDPAHNTPRDSGEFVYVWGGPYDTRDIIELFFSGTLSDDEIEQVFQDLDRDSSEWVPHVRRHQPPHDEDDEPPAATPPPRAEQLHSRMLGFIADAEDHLKEIEPQLDKRPPPGIGHNNPPEGIDEPPVTRKEFEELRAALEALKAQPVEPDEAGQTVADEAVKTVDGIGRRIGAYVLKQADNFVSEAVKTVAKAAQGALDWPPDGISGPNWADRFNRSLKQLSIGYRPSISRFNGRRWPSRLPSVVWMALFYRNSTRGGRISRLFRRFARGDSRRCHGGRRLARDAGSDRRGCAGSHKGRDGLVAPGHREEWAARRVADATCR